MSAVVSLCEFGNSPKNAVESLSSEQKEAILSLARIMADDATFIEYNPDGCYIFQAVKPLSENSHQSLIMVTKTRPNSGAYKYSLTVNSWGCFQHESINFDDIVRVAKAHFDQETRPQKVDIGHQLIRP